MLADDLLHNSALLTVEGWSHISVDVPSECTIEAVSQYLLEGTLPAEGTICSAASGPFELLDLAPRPPVSLTP